MKSKISFTLALATMLVLATGSVWGATERNVPVPYSTIQAAIDAADPDDTIIVAAGTYAPFTVDGKADITIQSNDVVTVQGVQSVGTAYTNRDCVVFVKDSTNIVLEGLDIEGNGLGTINYKNYGVIYENSSGEIKDCTVVPNTIGDMYSTAIGIWDSSEVTVDLCTIEFFGRIGIFIYNGCTVGIYDNTIEGQAYDVPGEVCYGIEVEGAYMNDDPDTASHATIIGNEISECDNTFTPAPTWASAAILVNGWLEYFSAADSTVIIEENNIHNNFDGICVIKSPSSSANSNNIHNNRQHGVLSAAAYDGTTVDFDATNNWWGDPRGPSRAMGKAKGHDQVKGDRVSPNVRFAPWLKEEILN